MHCYNFLARRSNNLDVEVAQASKIIALANGRGRTAMKTVAILAITLLPGIFVAVQSILQSLETLSLFFANLLTVSLCRASL